MHSNTLHCPQDNKTGPLARLALCQRSGHYGALRHPWMNTFSECYWLKHKCQKSG